MAAVLEQNKLNYEVDAENQRIIGFQYKNVEDFWNLSQNSNLK